MSNIMNTPDKIRIDKQLKTKLASAFSQTTLYPNYDECEESTTTTFCKEFEIDGEWLSIEGVIYTETNNEINELLIVLGDNELEGDEFKIIAQLFINNVNIA